MFFNDNGEVYEYENACDLPPAAETVGDSEHGL